MNLNKIIIILLCLFGMNDLRAQSSISVNAELANRYIWRGIVFYNAANIQPSVTFKEGGFSVGAVGIFDFRGKYNETDLWLSYNLKGVTLSLLDYFGNYEENNKMTDFKFFDYDNKTTAHIVELNLNYSGTDIPINLTASTFIYGADKNEKGDNDYSTYLEAGYKFKPFKKNLDLFAGAAINESSYYSTEKFSFINVGLKCSDKIKITEKFSLPLSFSIMINPDKEDLLFLFTIGI